jgi:hypothetical protein
MGEGEFVGNASIHWKIDHRANQDMDIQINDGQQVTRPHGVNVKRRVRGNDPRRERDDTFEVEMRFDNRADAEAALTKALNELDRKDGEVYATVIVPAPRRPHPPQRPDVRVNW